MELATLTIGKVAGLAGIVIETIRFFRATGTDTSTTYNCGRV